MLEQYLVQIIDNLVIHWALLCILFVATGKLADYLSERM
jgi:hypothetical protein